MPNDQTNQMNDVNEDLEDLFDGLDEDHSQTEPQDAPPADPEETAPEDIPPQEDGMPDDSAHEHGKNEPAPDKEEKPTETETLRKRLHDTQAAYHKSNAERRALQHEVDELRAKQASDDDWFGEKDKDLLTQKENELQAKEAELDRMSDQANLDRWEEAAAPVRAAHPDFDKVVIEGLGSMIDEKDGNPEVIALWEKHPDKSPAGAYQFAQSVNDLLLMQKDPVAYRERLRAEVARENHPGDTVTGKDGLDMYESADIPLGNAASDDDDPISAIFG